MRVLLIPPKTSASSHSFAAFTAAVKLRGNIAFSATQVQPKVLVRGQLYLMSQPAFSKYASLAIVYCMPRRRRKTLLCIEIFRFADTVFES